MITSVVLTYKLTTKIEIQRNQYQLKKEVYFDILTELTSISRIYYDIDKLEKKRSESRKELDNDIIELKKELENNKKNMLAKTDSSLSIEEQKDKLDPEFDKLCEKYKEKIDKTSEKHMKFLDVLDQEIEKIALESRSRLDRLDVQLMRLHICANDDVIDAFHAVLDEPEDERKFNSIIKQRLVPAMRCDLMGSKPKPWWMFLK